MVDRAPAGLRMSPWFVRPLDPRARGDPFRPGVVAFLDFTDPWGNRLGYCQDLAPSDQQPEYPGTSVTDASQFAAFENS